MKRMYSSRGETQSLENLDPLNTVNGSPLERCPSKKVITLEGDAPLLPVSAGECDALRQSKFRKQGSRVISALKSLTNSISQDYPPTGPSSSPNHHADIGRKISAALTKGQLEPTVIHRAKFKSRPSFQPSKEKDPVETDLSPTTSPTNSGNDASSGKESSPRHAESTGVTSLDSQSTSKSKGAIQQISEDKKLDTVAMVDGDFMEISLTPIAEMEHALDSSQDPTPTVVTVENAATAKIFFECYYNDATSDRVTPRSIRRHQLEGALNQNTSLSNAERDEKRIFWARTESDHLRETRSMKNRGVKSLHGRAAPASQYEVVKILGKGSFGVVRLVREKGDESTFSAPEKKEIYAMKVIRKSEMLRNSQEGHLRAERDFLVAAEGSRWIVPLIASFQDLNNLYLIMDYMPGGDFLGLLIRDNILSEAATKWYIAEMILCLEEAHSLHWIHRDVKPDNFLISASGHLKISDFGLAFDGHWSHDQAYFNHHRYSLLSKLGIAVEGDAIDKTEAGQTEVKKYNMVGKMAQAIGLGGRHERYSIEQNEAILNWRNKYGNRIRARSVVGTSQYMAPEVVKGEAYDGRCDWWSVAIILYECLYGHTPFLAEEGGRQATKYNIAKHHETFRFPSRPTVSRRCQDLIRCIIQDKEYRLCSKRYRIADQASQHRDYAGRYVYPNDAEEIKSHKWFRDIPWDRLHLIPPPFVPAIKSLDDTQYFDEDEPISDFSESGDVSQPSLEEIKAALQFFNQDVQQLATNFVSHPHDTIKLKRVERDIEALHMADEQKVYLKEFVRHYGRKEKKRPRDKLLRDKETAPKVLELRKKGAFLGYTYRRYRPARETYGRDATGSKRHGYLAASSASNKRNVWHRARISIQ